jgi:hypothetical protein
VARCLGVSLSTFRSYSFGNGGHLLLAAIPTMGLHKTVRVCNRPNADTCLVGKVMTSNGLTGRISIGNSPGASNLDGSSSSSIRAILLLDKMVSSERSYQG